MAVAPGTDIFSLMNDPFADLSDCEDIHTDFGDIFESFEDSDVQSEEREALLQLTEEMALITAELQQLKEDQTLIDYMTQPELSAASMKRRTQHSSSITQGKRRKTDNLASSSSSSSDDSDEDVASSSSSTSGFVRFMSKEDLLNTITHDLPPHYLEGVIRIVNPAFNPATATDEDLEFDINLLAEDVLYQLMQYVHNALHNNSNSIESTTKASASRKPTPAQPKRIAATQTNTKKVLSRIPPSSNAAPAPAKRNVPKKEGPRQRLMKRAPKKRTASIPKPAPIAIPVPAVKRRSAPPRKTKHTQQKKEQLVAQQIVEQVHFLGLPKKKDTALISGDLMREIFQSEEIIVRKCMSDEEEDEEVDILEV